MAETRLKGHPQYKDFGHPITVEKELQRHFFRKGFIFCCNMGDLWCNDTPDEDIVKVLQIVWDSPKATFLMLTKNTGRYLDFMHIMPPNAILGATIETDCYPKPGISKAPSLMKRYMVMWRIKDEYPQLRTMVCIEPIMDFDLWMLAALISAIHPLYVYLGYDNHGHHLPEPTLEKTQKLIEILKGFTEVRTKTLREAWDKASGSEEKKHHDSRRAQARIS